MLNNSKKGVFMENKKFLAHKKIGEFKTFGQYIMEGRDKKGLSRLSLVERIIDKGYEASERDIKLWERDAWYPDITMIYVLAEILEISPNDLLAAKQFMQEAGLNAIDMVTMRVVCKFVDISIMTVFWMNRIFMTVGLAIIAGVVWFNALSGMQNMQW